MDAGSLRQKVPRAVIKFFPEEPPPQLNQLGGLSIVVLRKGRPKKDWWIRPATLIACGLSKSNSGVAIVRDELNENELFFVCDTHTECEPVWRLCPLVPYESGKGWTLLWERAVSLIAARKGVEEASSAWNRKPKLNSTW